jgi:hypothetical protein
VVTLILLMVRIIWNGHFVLKCIERCWCFT